MREGEGEAGSGREREAGQQCEPAVRATGRQWRTLLAVLLAVLQLRTRAGSAPCKAFRGRRGLSRADAVALPAERARGLVMVRQRCAATCYRKWAEREPAPKTERK